MVEQNGLKVLETNKTFFARITNTLMRIFIPTKIGINGIIISVKRNSMLKVYVNYIESEELTDTDKQESLLNKYEDKYSIYLEAIDKYILDSVYKKVKSNTASNFEREILAKYYTIVSLKEKQYIEYKYKKQEYLINIDEEIIRESNRASLLQVYNPFYVSRMDTIYKGILKNYSIQLSDKSNTKAEGVNNIYNKIFMLLEDYITNVLEIKLKLEEKEEYKNIHAEYERYEQVIIGKLDERDILKKKMVLLGLSRYLFTHSLPLIAAEQCYIKLIKEGRALLLSDDNKNRLEKTFEMLIELMEEYNIKLLSNKIYWDKPENRESFKKFWDEYKSLENLDKDEYNVKKQILFLKEDLKSINEHADRYGEIIKIYKQKLVQLGAMKNLKNTCKTLEGNFVKIRCEK